MNKIFLIFLLAFCANISMFAFQLPNSNARKVRSLVLFVTFADQTNEPWSRSLSGWQTLYNSDDPSTLSARSFFTSASFGKVDFRGVFIEDSNSSDTVPDYIDIHPTGYYKMFNESPLGALTQAELWDREAKFRSRVVAHASARLPKDIVLDGDGNGEIDNVTITCRKLVTGSFMFTNWSGHVGHWNLSVNSIPIGPFTSISADSYHNPHVVEIHVHELGHYFGTPDVYTSGQDAYRTIQRSDMMQWWHNKRSFTSYYLWKSMKWIAKDEAKMISNSGSYVLNSLSSPTSQGVTYRIKSPNSKNEFFMVEYRAPHINEWWHKSEGMLVSLIIPTLGGNVRGNVYGNLESSIIQPKSGIVNALLLNTSINANTDPALRLSNGDPAGFSINNIRKVGGQLHFDVEYDDVPFINAHEVPDVVVGTSASTFVWDIGVNLSNKMNWTASSDVSWLTVQPDYKTSQLKMSCARNFSFSQRNATITLLANGAPAYKGYLVQRGNRDANVLWVPEPVNDTIVVHGDEDSHRFRIIGEFDGYDFEGYPNIQRGDRQDQDIRYTSFYINRNTTAAPRNFNAFVNSASGRKKYIIKQLPPTAPAPVYKYPYSSVPGLNDGKWYYVRSERAQNSLESYLGPKKDSNRNIVLGVRSFALNDSLLWTVESVNGGVVLRNKALGYVDMSLFNASKLRFTSVKPNSGFEPIENFGHNGYYVIGLAFKGKSTSVKGIHIGIDDFVLPTYFDLKDNSTLFFELADLSYLIDYGNTYLKVTKPGTSIGNTSISAYDRLKTALQNASKYVGKDIALDHKNGLMLEISLAVDQLKNELVLYKVSTSSNPIWYKIYRIGTEFWQMLKDDERQYLKYNSDNASLTKENFDGSTDIFLFRLEKSSDGKLYIIPKLNSNLKVTHYGKNGGVYLSTKNDSYTKFEITPAFSIYGVNFLIKTSHIDNQHFYMCAKANDKSLYVNSINELTRSKIQLGMSNLLTISDPSLNFNFEAEEIPTSTILVNDDVKFNRFSVVDRKIIFEDSNIKFELFNSSGICLNVRNQLLPGVYVLKYSNRSEKVVVY